MRRSSGAARGPRYVPAVVSANPADTISAAMPGAEAATAAAVLTEEVFLGIDTSKTKHMVSRFAPGEEAKPQGSGSTADDPKQRRAHEDDE